MRPSLSDPARRSRSSQFRLDELDVDPVAGQAVERAVVGGPVDAPEAGIADVGEPGAELVAQEPEQPEHRVSVGCSIGHDFRGFEVGFLVEQQSQDEQAVAQCAGHHDGVQAGELVGDEVVVGDAAAGAEVLGIGSGVDGVAGCDEADAVGRGHLAASPDVGDRQGVLRRDDPGVGGSDSFGPNEVLADPGQPVAAECRLVGADHWLEADVAGLGDQRTAQAGGELLDARMALADMGKGVGETGACGSSPA